MAGTWHEEANMAGLLPAADSLLPAADSGSRSPLAPSSNRRLIHAHCTKAVDCAPRILSMPPLPETGQRPLRPLGRARAICATGRAAGPSLHKLHEFKADEAGSASADAL